MNSRTASWASAKPSGSTDRPPPSRPPPASAPAAAASAMSRAPLSQSLTRASIVNEVSLMRSSRRSEKFPVIASRLRASRSSKISPARSKSPEKNAASAAADPPIVSPTTVKAVERTVMRELARVSTTRIAIKAAVTKIWSPALTSSWGSSVPRKASPRSSIVSDKPTRTFARLSPMPEASESRPTNEINELLIVVAAWEIVTWVFANCSAMPSPPSRMALKKASDVTFPSMTRFRRRATDPLASSRPRAAAWASGKAPSRIELNSSARTIPDEKDWESWRRAPEDSAALDPWIASAWPVISVSRKSSSWLAPSSSAAIDALEKSWVIDSSGPRVSWAISKRRAEAALRLSWESVTTRSWFWSVW